MITASPFPLQLFSWGHNHAGQLGLGHDSDQATPQRVEALGSAHVQHVAGGCFHCLALTDKGQVFSWGRNDNGELGMGSTTKCATPSLIQTEAERLGERFGELALATGHFPSEPIAVCSSVFKRWRLMFLM